MSDNKNFGGYIDEHHLIELKQPPSSLVELRNLLQQPEFKDIREKAEAAATFEEALGVIALQLDILLDGTYDVGPLCKVLVAALTNREKFKSTPHLRAEGLIDVELVERKDTVAVERKKQSNE